MADANYYARTILADKKLRMEAQLWLNVTSNRLYILLIKEYFTKVWSTIKAPAEMKVKTRRESR